MELHQEVAYLVVNLGQHLVQVRPSLEVVEHLQQHLQLLLVLPEPHRLPDKVCSEVTLDLQQEVEVFFPHQILHLSGTQLVEDSRRHGD